MSDPRMSYPDLLPTKLAAGEEYATVEQILRADDLPQATIHVPQWRAKIRVRALSLSERDIVQRQPTVTAQYCMAWQYGCMNPQFTAEQAKGLADKNFHAIEQGANFILLLSALDQEAIDRVVAAQTTAEPATSASAPESPPADETDADADSAADPNHPARMRRVA